MTTLSIRRFAHLGTVDVEFGDLTVLVGAQATGKSLALQWLKAALDGKHLVEALRAAGHEVDSTPDLIDLVFGLGMRGAWHADTQIQLDGETVAAEGLAQLGSKAERVFFIPAHRSLLIADGWAAPFQKLTAEMPVVARLFSQNLFDRFSSPAGEKLFPNGQVLDREYRQLIDGAVFHGGTVGIDKGAQHTRRLKLMHGRLSLPFMTWTAGQREFTPLLLGLYHLLPERSKKLAGVDWVVVEEPELGLHPQAISVFLLLVLELLGRGYRVVLSTHSPVVLTAVWMLGRLQHEKAGAQAVLDGFGVPRSPALVRTAKAALGKHLATYLFAIENGQVHSKDISSLDPSDEDEDVAGWGGLSGFATRFGAAVRNAVNA